MKREKPPEFSVKIKIFFTHSTENKIKSKNTVESIRATNDKKVAKCLFYYDSIIIESYYYLSRILFFKLYGISNILFKYFLLMSEIQL